MTKYFVAYSQLPLEDHVPYRSEKAIGLSVAGGYTTANDTMIYISRKLIKHDERPMYRNGQPLNASEVLNGSKHPDDVYRVYVPCWVFKKNGVDPTAIRELSLSWEDTEEI